MDTFKELKVLVDKEKSHRELWPSIAQLLAELRQQFASNKDFSGALLDHDINIDKDDLAAYIKMATWTEDVWQDALANSKLRNPRRFLEQVLGWDAEYYAVKDTEASWDKSQDRSVTVEISENESIEALEPKNTETAVPDNAENKNVPSSKKPDWATSKVPARLHSKLRSKAVMLVNYFNPRWRSQTANPRSGTLSALNIMAKNEGGRLLLRKLAQNIESGDFGSECISASGGGNAYGPKLFQSWAGTLSPSATAKVRRAELWSIDTKSSEAEMDAFFALSKTFYDLSIKGELDDNSAIRLLTGSQSAKIRQPDLSAFSNVTPLRPAKTQMQPIGEEDIVIYGEKLWPSSVHDYLDVWHCFHFWEDLDRKLAISMPRPAERGDAYIKLSAWAKGIDPVLGSVLEKAGRAMSHRPEQSEQTRAAMRMIGQGRG